MGQNFTVTSMIGIVALSGVVIRASLLIIDFILDYLRQGKSLEEARALAGAIRLRPDHADDAGGRPRIGDHDPRPGVRRPRLSLIFGTMTSSVLTLFLVPLLFQMYAKRHISALREA